MNDLLIDYEDIKQNLATNITKYRKHLNLTQLELAEKLNYSDKAVSKWERAEAVPDIVVIKQLSILFGVKIDTLLDKPTVQKPLNTNTISKKRTTIGLCATGLVWLVAMCAFAFIHIIFPQITHTWLSFIYAIPISCIVLLVLTSVWGKSLTNTIIISLLVWSTILSVYLTLFYTLPSTPNNLWELFLIGIPLQGLVIFWFLYRRIK
jgi:transcriptional regulator with XRE-family HTH domain